MTLGKIEVKMGNGNIKKHMSTKNNKVSFESDKLEDSLFIDIYDTIVFKRTKGHILHVYDSRKGLVIKEAKAYHETS